MRFYIFCNRVKSNIFYNYYFKLNKTFYISEYKKKSDWKKLFYNLKKKNSFKYNHT